MYRLISPGTVLLILFCSTDSLLNVRDSTRTCTLMDDVCVELIQKQGQGVYMYSDIKRIDKTHDETASSYEVLCKFVKNVFSLVKNRRGEKKKQKLKGVFNLYKILSYDESVERERGFFIFIVI